MLGAAASASSISCYLWAKCSNILDYTRLFGMRPTISYFSFPRTKQITISGVQHSPRTSALQKSLQDFNIGSTVCCHASEPPCSSRLSKCSCNKGRHKSASVNGKHRICQTLPALLARPVSSQHGNAASTWYQSIMPCILLSAHTLTTSTTFKKSTKRQK